MITFESPVGDERCARGFFRELPDPQTAEAIIAERYWDDGDQAREPGLRRLLSRSNVSAIVYPTVGHRDVLQVFLRDDSELVFACVLVSGARLHDMLARSSAIVEGFGLQVLPSKQLSIESVRAALQSWIERCFPGLVLPHLAVERWTGPEGIQQELLELLLSHAHASAAVSAVAADADADADAGELQPDPSLAQPPYEIAA